MPNNDLLPPELDLAVKKKRVLPKRIDDPFGDKEVDEVINHPEEYEIEPLLRDVEVNLKINDVRAARDLYRKLLHVYNGLTKKEKETYYDKVFAFYERLSPKKSFMKKVFSR